MTTSQKCTSCKLTLYEVREKHYLSQDSLVWFIADRCSECVITQNATFAKTLTGWELENFLEQREREMQTARHCMFMFQKERDQASKEMNEALAQVDALAGAVARYAARNPPLTVSTGEPPPASKP